MSNKTNIDEDLGSRNIELYKGDRGLRIEKFGDFVFSRRRKNFFARLAISVSILSLCLSLQRNISLNKIESNSMSPALEHGDWVVLIKNTEIRRYDLVVFANPANYSSLPLIKRAIGMPGDIVEIRKHALYVNNEKPGFYTDTFEDPDFKIRVPKNGVFVLGDNFNVSADSRHLGIIAISDIEA